MIDVEVYDTLEKLVKKQKDTFEKYKDLFSCENEDYKLGINSVQSLIRQAVIDQEQLENPIYSRLIYGKEGYESIKISNLKFDLEFLLAVLESVPGIAICEKWTVLMVVLKIIAELRHCKIKLSPAMSLIVFYLNDNGYKNGHEIIEDELRNIIVNYQNKGAINTESEFGLAIENLLKLKIISINDGKVQLIEKIIP